MLIALLLVLGVNLGVIIAILASVVARKRWIRRQPGAFRGAIRIADGELAGIRPRWSRGYGRWVHDVLVWSAAPLLFRTQLVPVDEMTQSRAAYPGEIKGLGDHPVVVRVTSGNAAMDLAADADQLELLAGPFDRSAELGSGRTTRPG